MPRRRRYVLLSAIAAAVVAVPFLTGATSSHAAHADMITCGATITTSITFTQGNVTPCAGNGLVVGADGITINLNGVTLSGQGASTGIVVGSFKNVVVKNGEIYNFGTGVSSTGDGLNLSKLAVSLSGANGIDISGGTGDLISGNFVENSQGVGILFSGNPVKETVTGNRVQGSSGNGIELDTPVNATVKGNVALSNTGDGISLIQGTAQVTGNIAASNFGNGIVVNGVANTPLAGLVSGNRASFNGGLGMQVNSQKDGGKNVVQANGSAKQYAGVVCVAVSG